jgi:hypothetical protein
MPVVVMERKAARSRADCMMQSLLTWAQSSRRYGEGAEAAPAYPAWITQELIELTLTTWQPYYTQVLNNEDAVEMLLTVGSLYRVLAGDPGHEPLHTEETEQDDRPASICAQG